MTDKLTPKQADVGCKYHLHPMQYSAWVEKMGIDWAERFCVEIKPIPTIITSKESIIEFNLPECQTLDSNSVLIGYDKDNGLHIVGSAPADVTVVKLTKEATEALRGAE